MHSGGLMPVYTVEEIEILSEYVSTYTISDENLDYMYETFGEQATIDTISDRLLTQFNDAVATHALEVREEDTRGIAYKDYKLQKTEFKMHWQPRSREVLFVGGPMDGTLSKLPEIGATFYAPATRYNTDPVDSLIEDVLESKRVNQYELSGWSNTGHWVYSIVD